MVGQIAEFVWLLAKFVWHYRKADKHLNHPGFGPHVEATRRAKARWAWTQIGGN